MIEVIPRYADRILTPSDLTTVSKGTFARSRCGMHKKVNLGSQLKELGTE